MANDFYNASGAPATSANLTSATVRAEFTSIDDAFDKLPTMTANGDGCIFVNSAGTALVAKTAAQARTLLGLVIGTDVQAYDADLAAIAALTSAANKMPYSTGAQTWALADLTAAGRALLDDADAAAQRTTLGVAYGPAFSAYRTTLQTLPSGGSGSKFQGTSEEFDTANCYDSATNYRFTPTVAGYYQFNAGISWTLAASAGKQTSIILYKNGSAFKNGSASDTNVADYAVNALSALVYMNGSTDYAELFLYQNTGSNLDTVGGATTCYFQGFLARPA